jgi:predicted nucleic acid-binding Zn ribbon protein
MAFPIRTCVVCGEEFELKPDKPGFANRCPECSEPDEETATESEKGNSELNAERRRVMRDLLYRKDS